MGLVSGGGGALSFGATGLCFIKKSLRAPNENEAIAGSVPKNRSSSPLYSKVRLWFSNYINLLDTQDQ